VEALVAKFGKLFGSQVLGEVNLREVVAVEFLWGFRVR
jgi:hypothetical protein